MSKRNNIRWTQTQACAEFSISHEAIRRGFSKANVLPGPDGCFSTQDICKAIFGDYDSEKTRLTKAQADVAEIKRETMLKNFLPRDAVERVWGGTLLQLRNKINDAEISQQLKVEILKDLQDISIDEYLAEKAVEGNSDDLAGEDQAA